MAYNFHIKVELIELFIVQDPVFLLEYGVLKAHLRRKYEN